MSELAGSPRLGDTSSPDVTRRTPPRSQRTVRRRWPLWIIVALILGAMFVAGSVVLMVVVDQVAPGVPHFDYWRELLISTPIVGVLGAIILVHRPKHPIGLVLLLSGAANSVALLAGSFAVAASVLGWPLLEVGAWLSNLLRVRAFTLTFGLLFLLYPSGTPSGRIGRWMVRTVVTAVAVSAVAHALKPGPLTDFPAHSNPFGAFSLEVLGRLDFIANVVILVVGLVGGLATIATRLVRSHGIERLQIRVFLYAAIMAVAGLVAAGLVLPEESESPLGAVLWTLFPMMVVAAMAMAIVRYRLYDIDRLISRTVSYGILTAFLAAVYLGLIFVIGGALPFRGGLPVAVSTLAVAALFTPARIRIQSLVDRRFYRSRYDAQSTIEDLNARIRDHTNPEGLIRELEGVVIETLQPAAVSIWLRSPP